MGGWKTYIAELGLKAVKGVGKVFGGSGAKAAEQVAKVSKSELKQAADFRKANAAIKSIGNPKFKVDGVPIPRFEYAKGRFGDLKTGSQYTRKEFSQFQSHFNNLYKGGRTSGYKAWESSLPKANFTPHFNPLNPTPLKQETKIAGQEAKVVAKETSKLGSDIGEAVAKQRWYQNADNWKAAGQLGVKAMNKTGRAIHGTAEYAFRASRGTIKHSKDLAILSGTGWVAYNVLSGNGVVKPLMGAVGGDEAKQGGAVNLAEQIIAGESAPQLHENLTGMVGGAMNEAGDVYYRLKDGTIAVASEAGQLYQGGKEMITGAFNGNGMVNDGSGYYSDPTAQQYPTMSQMMGQQGNGMVNGLMGGMNNALNSVTNGNVSKLDLAGLLAAAYMMFGRFGWLGKAASLMLGGMTLKNINNHQQGYQLPQGYQQQQSTGQNNVASAYQQQLKTLQMQTDNDENVVVRSRGF